MRGKVLVVDDAVCDGCGDCVTACSTQGVDEGDTRVSRIDVVTTGEDTFVPLTCNHCESPSCALACPTMACRIDPEGARVIIDVERCIGCRTCVVACPFSHARYDPDGGTSVKCDLCAGAPECVAACRPRALRWVERDEASLARRRTAVACLGSLVSGTYVTGRPSTPKRGNEGPPRDQHVARHGG